MAAVEDEASATGLTASGNESTTSAASMVIGQIVAADPDGAITGYAVVDDQAAHHGTLEVNADGSYRFTAEDANWNGSDSFTVRSTDALGGTTEFTLSVKVNDTRTQFRIRCQLSRPCRQIKKRLLTPIAPYPAMIVPII